MHSRTLQEDLLVIEALVDYHWRRKEKQSERAARAWVLAHEIAASHGLEVVDALAQRDEV
ncbi:hypothetical protein HTZ84_22390 [Haloterrigena sp. SYSU A558-1]|uniref:Uncharacterized protein n=1 Tax=Haloterrigena gelatinilytica TaxID=2741724 RepID=A0ABX2LMY1_9EURY|nr:hypothetical protein [Haloterrigena gelatinilytica]NUC75017.1 hypothetical protein [Haloterrigena gelatinilytica]